MWSKPDYDYFINKGYNNQEIKKFWDRDHKNNRKPVYHGQPQYGNDCEYTWHEINQALMDTGHSPKAILRIMVALKDNRK
jgi:hypothetical protein